MIMGKNSTNFNVPNKNEITNASDFENFECIFC